MEVLFRLLNNNAYKVNQFYFSTFVNVCMFRGQICLAALLSLIHIALLKQFLELY